MTAKPPCSPSTALRLRQGHDQPHGGARLGWHYLDSGAIYRAVGQADRLGRRGPGDPRRRRLRRTHEIRFETQGEGEPHVLGQRQGRDPPAAHRDAGAVASAIAAYPACAPPWSTCSWLSGRPPGLVADGRDMGTIIFPDARFKVFLTASAEERARRRYKQLKDKGVSANLDSLLHEIAARDERDAGRAVAPLKPAADAVLLDSTGMPITEVIDRVLAVLPASLRPS
jgi:cytidylate kinase